MRFSEEATDERPAEETARAAAAGRPTDEDLDFEAPAKGSAEELLDATAHEHDPLDPMRHSAAHVMAEAVLDLFPGTKLGIGPAIDGGFYYDFDLPRPLTTEDLPAIEERMRQSVAADHPFVRKEMDPDKGRTFFQAKGQPYKVEILDDLRTAAKISGAPAPVVSTYEHGQFIDLCRGPHVESTGKIGPFKLLSVAGAYWRGREDRPMLQRIYGTVWATQEELDLYLWRRAGGAQARPPAPRRRARPVQLPRRPPGRGLLAPQGLDALPHARERHARAAGGARLPGDLHAADGGQEALGAVGPLGPLSRAHVPDRGGGADLQPQADELPRRARSSTRAARAPTATCRCACPSTASCTATSCPACCPG